MKPVSVILVATASTVLLTAAAWRVERPLTANETHARSEVARLRAHFDSVDTELRTRDVSHLSAEQRANRVKLIGWLKEYRDAGVFPINDRFADRAVPFFRDTKGTLCAMAYLVDRSGGSDIVDHIAKTRNNAYIRELTDDRKLVAWLDASGLSVAEAARIQPAYDGEGGCCWIGDPPPANTSRVSGEYALVSMGLGGTSLGTLGFNMFSPSRASGAAGLLAGVASIVAGASRMDDITGDRRVARANAVVGSLAVIGGLRGMFARPTAETRAPVQGSSKKGVSVTSLAPDLVLAPKASRLGLTMRAEF
jgi:hypothetical protein